MLPYLLAIAGGYLIGSSTKKFEEGGEIKYKIFEGYDHYKGEPMYQVVGVENEYEGEYHRDRKDAEKELAEIEGKFELGGVMANGGEVARTILQQLGGAGRLNAMTGAYNFIDRGNGLSFKIKNQRANYIKITLNSKDLYDVEVGRIRGNTYKVVKTANDLYFDQLKPFLEEATGMYFSLGF